MRIAQSVVTVLSALALLASELNAQDVSGWNGLSWGASKTAILKKFAGKIKSQEGPAVVTTVEIGKHRFNAILSLEGGGLTAVRLGAYHITGDPAPLAEDGWAPASKIGFLRCSSGRRESPDGAGRDAIDN